MDITLNVRPLNEEDPQLSPVLKENTGHEVNGCIQGRCPERDASISLNKCCFLRVQRPKAIKTLLWPCSLLLIDRRQTIILAICLYSAETKQPVSTCSSSNLLTVYDVQWMQFPLNAQAHVQDKTSCVYSSRYLVILGQVPTGNIYVQLLFKQPKSSGSGSVYCE